MTTASSEIRERLESITRRRQQGTATLLKLWTDGDLTQADLPCHQSCNGYIQVVATEEIHGMCPVYMRANVCPLVELKERERTARLVLAGFGVRYHNPNLSMIRARKAVQAFLGSLNDNLAQGRGMVITGDVGVGKTMMLAYMAKQMLQVNVGVWKVHVPELIEAIDSRSARQTVERCITVQVLMLDDIGSGDMSDKVLGVIEGIVEHRHENHKSTFVTTNMTREELIDNLPLRRMVDRWRETNMMVRIAGDSQRHL